MVNLSKIKKLQLTLSLKNVSKKKFEKCLYYCFELRPIDCKLNNPHNNIHKCTYNNMVRHFQFTLLCLKDVEKNKDEVN